MDKTAINSVPGVITFESNTWDSCFGANFLPSLSNSSRNLSSSAAYSVTQAFIRKKNELINNKEMLGIIFSR